MTRQRQTTLEPPYPGMSLILVFLSESRTVGKQDSHRYCKMKMELNMVSFGVAVAGGARTKASHGPGLTLCCHLTLLTPQRCSLVHVTSARTLLGIIKQQ